LTRPRRSVAADQSVWNARGERAPAAGRCAGHGINTIGGRACICFRSPGTAGAEADHFALSDDISRIEQFNPIVRYE